MVYMASPQKKTNKKQKKHACFSYDLARSDMDVIEHSTDETQDQRKGGTLLEEEEHGRLSNITLRHKSK